MNTLEILSGMLHTWIKVSVKVNTNLSVKLNDRNSVKLQLPDSGKLRFPFYKCFLQMAFILQQNGALVLKDAAIVCCAQNHCIDCLFMKKGFPMFMKKGFPTLM